MNRDDYCAALRQGLSGLPEAAIADLVSDYETHFDDGVAAGRSEEELADALGDPRRLAKELRVEAGLQRWEDQRTPANAVAAVIALVGLGAIDVIVLLPVLAAVGGILMGVFILCIIGFIFGGGVLVIGPFAGGPGGPLAAILFGIGSMAGAVSTTAILALITIGIVNALVWYARLHYRALNQARQA